MRSILRGKKMQVYRCPTMYTIGFSPSVYPSTSWGYYILSGEWFESDDKHSDEQNKTEKNFNSERELCRNANLLNQ